MNTEVLLLLLLLLLLYSAWTANGGHSRFEA